MQNSDGELIYLDNVVPVFGGGEIFAMMANLTEQCVLLVLS